MIKAMRIGTAAAVFALVLFFFLDFAEILPAQVHALAMLQLIPAVMAGAIVWLAALMLITWLAGRIYCSALCPLGIMQDIFAWVSRNTSKKRRRYKYAKPRRGLRLTVLGITVICFLFGFTAVISLIDPYSAFGRIAGGIARPAYLAGNNLAAGIAGSLGNHSLYRVEIVTASLFSLIVAAVTLLAVGYMSWKRGRLYCNTICPVGTLLGLIGRRSLVRIRIDGEKCVGCGACAAKCKSQCIDSRNMQIDGSRCVDCFNCLGSCKYGALNYRLPERKKKNAGTENAPPDTSRRKFIAMSATLAASASVLHARSGAGQLWQDAGYQRLNPITPPGSRSRDRFGRKCTACHLCVAKCPSKVLKPAFLEYGAAGIMQPMMYFDKGFCNYNCTVCSDVCPNGALEHISAEEKQLTQVGRVVFVRERCVVVTDGTSCGACSEHCPTQAVTMVPFSGALTIPKTDPDICVGCGGCEFICPVRPSRAIYVEGNVEHIRREEFHQEEKEEVQIEDFGF